MYKENPLIFFNYALLSGRLDGKDIGVGIILNVTSLFTKELYIL